MTRLASLVALAAAMMLGSAAIAQTQQAHPVGTPPPAPEGWEAPRTEWGDLDFRGMYPLVQGRTPMQRPERFGTQAVYTDEEYAEVFETAQELQGSADREDANNQLGQGNWFEWGNALRQTSLIVEPAHGRIVMNEEGKRRAAEMKSSWSEEVFDSLAEFNSLDRCITKGLPASMIPFPYNNGIRVFQSPGVVVLDHEMLETRIIHLDKGEKLPDEIETWIGHSRGRFEGNSLVVETTNFNGESPMVIVGPSNEPIPTSKSLKVTERFTLYGPEQVYYEMWVEDPEVLAEPFKMGFPWTRDDSYESFEYACHEGNTIVPAYITATSPRFADYRVERGGTRDPAPVE